MKDRVREGASHTITLGFRKLYCKRDIRIEGICREIRDKTFFYFVDVQYLILLMSAVD